MRVDWATARRMIERVVEHPAARDGDGLHPSIDLHGGRPAVIARYAITFKRHADAIANAVWLGVNNARLEAMHSIVRLMSHRARRFRRLQSLLSLIALVCGRIPVALPT